MHENAVSEKAHCSYICGQRGWPPRAGCPVATRCMVAPRHWQRPLPECCSGCSRSATRMHPSTHAPALGGVVQQHAAGVVSATGDGLEREAVQAAILRGLATTIPTPARRAAGGRQHEGTLMAGLGVSEYQLCVMHESFDKRAVTGA